ncbi:MAG: SRPBCC family protein [Actinomycetota bacterium]
MDLVRELTVPASADRVFAYVADLDEYPAWMPLIAEVDRIADEAPGGGSTDAPAWSVVLQAQVGPFTRSKRLRMIRTAHVDGERAVFERDEVDGRDHAMWRLDSEIESIDAAQCRLRMSLHYGGRLWGGPVLERVLDAQIAEASVNLLGLVSAPG